MKNNSTEKIKIGTYEKSRLLFNYYKAIRVDDKRISRKLKFILIALLLEGEDKFLIRALDNGFPIALQPTRFKTLYLSNFWEREVFEELAKYVYWLFNEQDIETIGAYLLRENFSLTELKKLELILKENPHPYSKSVPENFTSDNYVKKIKISKISNNDIVKRMFSTDKINRNIILNYIENQITRLEDIEYDFQHSTEVISRILSDSCNLRKYIHAEKWNAFRNIIKAIPAGGTKDNMKKSLIVECINRGDKDMPKYSHQIIVFVLKEINYRNILNPGMDITSFVKDLYEIFDFPMTKKEENLIYNKIDLTLGIASIINKIINKQLELIG